MNDASAHPVRQALTHVVQDAMAVAERLSHVLEREKAALIDQDVDAIERAVAAKHSAAADLETLEERRQDLCRDLLGDATPERGALSAALDDPQLWPRFCAALRACHEANAVNGRLVNLRRRHVRQALHILSGSPRDAADTYGPDAEAGTGSASQVLGSA